MSIRAKIILAMLVAITLVGVGYFFIKPKSKVLPPINTVPQLEEIDTSDWQTYSFEFKGKEDIRLIAQFKYPQSWSVYEAEVGNYVVENEIYKELIENKKTLIDFDMTNYLRILPGNVEYLDENLEYRMKYGKRTSNSFFDTFRGFEQLLKQNADFFESEENMIGTSEFVDVIYEDKGYVSISGQINPTYEDVQKYIPIFLAVVKSLKISINTTPQKVIDTSNWQTYRNEKLGFEIKMSKEWSGGYYLGRFDPDDIELWQDQVGGARFNGPFRVSSSPQFSVRVKDSDLTLEEFARKVGVSKGENILINNLSAKKAPGEDVEAVLIKGDKRYYYFEFVVSVNNSINDFILWNKIISTFKPLN